MFADSDNTTDVRVVVMRSAHRIMGRRNLLNSNRLGYQAESMIEGEISSRHR